MPDGGLVDRKGDRGRPRSLTHAPTRWVLLAAAVGLADAGILSGWLHLGRGWFVLGHALVVGGLAAAYLAATRIGPGMQLRRRWRAGLVGGVVLGAVLARGVSGQPASARPDGANLAASLLWLGAVYGTADALLISVLPVLAVYGSRSAEELRAGAGRARWGGLALVASLLVAAAYHLGFEEFRGAALVQPLIGNGIITAGYLLTGNPLAPVLAHVIMHGAAVLHGAGTTVQLPPHY